MDTILDMTNVFLSSVCFCLLPIDAAWGNIVFFSCRVIALAFFWKNSAGHRHNGCNLLMFQCNG